MSPEGHGERGISRRKLIGGAAAGAAGAALPGAVAPDRTAARPRTRRRSADVAIVGAGFAGLTAALELVQAGKSVVVLEARNRVGGRVHNKRIGDGEISEKGGTFTGPTQDRLMAMARRFGVDMFPTFVDGENVYVNSAGQRSTYSDTGPTGTAPPDPLILPDLALVVSRLNEMSTTVDVERPYAAPQAAARDGQTFETWINANSTSPQFREIVPVATRPIFGAEPRELSLLYVLFYIAASGNEQNPGTFERNFNTRNGAQELRFKGGTQRICNRMARRLGPDRVIKRAPVGRIKQGRGGVTVHGPRGHGQRQAGDRRDPAGPGGADRVRPGAARHPRSAHPANLAGDADEGHRRLPQTVLARRGVERHRRLLRRAGAGDL